MVTVLLVDDSPVDRKLAQRLLSQAEEVEVLEAGDGNEALAQLNNGREVDVVVTDMQMPGMTGMELLSRIVGDRPELPVVLMTARGSELLAVEALERGAASYVPKQRLSADLVDTVERVWLASIEDEEYGRVLNHRIRTESVFRLENDLSLLMSVASYLQQSLTGVWKCSTTTRMRVGTALEEALTNAYYWGNLEMDKKLRETDHQQFFASAMQRAAQAPYCDRRIEVDAKLELNEATFIIRDDGPGFDVTTLQNAENTPDLEEAAGRGLALMQTFMDEVTFNEQGNEVTMIKRYAGE